MQFSPAAIAAFIALAVAGFLYIRSQTAKDAHQAALDLAELRGERLIELEKIVANLRVEVADLRSMVSAMTALKGSDIASVIITAIRADAELRRCEG